MNLIEVFTAGQSKDFFIRGNYFRIKSRTGVQSDQIDVLFYKDGARLELDLTDCDAGDFAFAPGGFDRVNIASAEAMTIVFQVAQGEVGSNRVTGVVSVEEGGNARTAAGKAFARSVFQTAVAAQYSHVQLWNPVSSGKVLVVSDLGPLADTLGNLHVVKYTAALSTLQAAGPENKLCSPAAVAASIAELRTEANAAQLGTLFHGLWTGTALTYQWRLGEPFRVLPGAGFGFRSVNVNESVRSHFHWYEES